jgi:hypothetical protein
MMGIGDIIGGMKRKSLSPLVLLLAIALFLPVAGCGKRARKIDPRPRQLVAELGTARLHRVSGNVSSQASGFQDSTLGEKDRYIVTKAGLIRWCNEGRNPVDFMRSLGVDAADWQFMDDFYWMDPSVRSEVEKEVATVSAPALVSAPTAGEGAVPAAVPATNR